MPIRRYESPLGPLWLRSFEGALKEIRFDRECLAQVEEGDAADPVLEATCAQLSEYFDSERIAFDVHVAPDGTDFQRAVWRELASIPFGATRSYQEIADVLGKPNATRAVGAANGQNPISIVIPCHRVVGSDGSLTGYAGGLAFKRGLLALEGSLGPQQGELF